MFLRSLCAGMTHEFCHYSTFSQNIHNDEIDLAPLLEPCEAACTPACCQRIFVKVLTEIKMQGTISATKGGGV